MRRNTACKVTFLCVDPPRLDASFFPGMPVILDPISSEAAAASPLRSAIANIFTWPEPSAPLNLRSVLPVFVSTPLSIDQCVAPAPMEVGAHHLRKHDAYDSSLSRFVCGFLGEYGAGPTQLPNLLTSRRLYFRTEPTAFVQGTHDSYQVSALRI